MKIPSVLTLKSTFSCNRIDFSMFETSLECFENRKNRKIEINREK